MSYTSDKSGAEIAWFAPICDGDDDFLGNRNPLYKSNWQNTSQIVKTADHLGYRNILCPSSYQVGQDTLSFVAGMAPITDQINFLAAFLILILSLSLFQLQRIEQSS